MALDDFFDIVALVARSMRDYCVSRASFALQHCELEQSCRYPECSAIWTEWRDREGGLHFVVRQQPYPWFQGETNSSATTKCRWDNAEGNKNVTPLYAILCCDDVFGNAVMAEEGSWFPPRSRQ